MIFHSFVLGDCEDPEIYAAGPMFDWQKTEQGKWVMEHGSALTYEIHPEFTTMGYRVTIRGCLKPEDEVYYILKYQ